MNWLKKIKSLAALMFVCIMLASASLTSCKPGDGSTEDAKEESAEHPAGDTTKADHPQGEAEHPKSDTTKVEN